ncbi:uncharacterized protein G2W53_018212 [Senna tora]|uniref:Uncharacterized protein n=1 Tax=Senna tora TaxID=362788 RepID=A0A834TRK6_9FABA|nr:uncharacterized protein G2W53_018212 [Senna tora]
MTRMVEIILVITNRLILVTIDSHELFFGLSPVGLGLPSTAVEGLPCIEGFGSDFE